MKKRATKHERKMILSAYNQGRKDSLSNKFFDSPTNLMLHKAYSEGWADAVMSSEKTDDEIVNLVWG